MIGRLCLWRRLPLVGIKDWAVRKALVELCLAQTLLKRLSRFLQVERAVFRSSWKCPQPCQTDLNQER